MHRESPVAAVAGGYAAWSVSSYEQLPSGLPVPADDGAADHLPGRALAPLPLRSTGGGEVDLGALAGGRTVLYIYPRTGTPGEPLPAGWDGIPGARGCTPEACSFRDHHAELRAAGAAVLGLSAQSGTDQDEAAGRLRLPYPLLADPELQLAEQLGLPTFSVDGMVLYRRLTLVVRDGVVEHAFYPVFPPDAHAAQVLQWLREHPAG
ncbi:MAG: putative MerR family transcriptional regulator/peroxidase [Chloroflexi bacterium]|nr:putative MerR family transcriptional regulator/peroxidase [Chloroflexota bacterium]